MRRVFAALLLAVGAAAAQDCAVDGVVIDTATGRPVEGARVSAPSAADLFTDAAGRFCLPGKAQQVRVTKPGYLAMSLHWQNRGSAANLTVKLSPTSDIAGQVLDEDGNPMAGVAIRAGRQQGATTDAEGRYRIANLLSGNYRLYCRLPQKARGDLLQRDEKTGEMLGYADTYYFPGVEDAARAVPVNVAPGVSAGGFDFRLRRVLLVDFTGHLVDRASGAALHGSAVELDPGNEFTDESWGRRNADAKGAFRFERIPPGRYTLMVYRGGAEDAGARPYRVPMEIGRGGLADAEIRVPEYVSVTLKIVAPHPERTDGGVGVALGRPSLKDPRSLVYTRPWCRLDEACVVRDIPPGEWTFDVEARMRENGDAPRELYVGSVRFGQQDAWGPVQVSEGANPPLEVVLTADAGTLTATLTDDDGNRVPGLLVVKSLDRGVTIRPALCCRVAGLLPGDYEVTALTPGNGDGIPANCGDRAVKVTITAGQSSTVNLKPCGGDR